MKAPNKTVAKIKKTQKIVTAIVLRRKRKKSLHKTARRPQKKSTRACNKCLLTYVFPLFLRFNQEGQNAVWRALASQNSNGAETKLMAATRATGFSRRKRKGKKGLRS